MRLILDSSVIIAAERRGDTVEQFYRANTPAIRLRCEAFLNELFEDLTVYPYTKETAMLAGKGVVIPFGDLLIGATALLPGYSVWTINPRDFRRIPGLNVVQF